MNDSLEHMDLSHVSTAQIADACVRLGHSMRVAPHGIGALTPGPMVGGPARPVTVYGSVDIFLEAMEISIKGEVLVINNNGRTDEGCIGDLSALEVQLCGLKAILVWGCHRDTAELKEIGLPIFSYGACPKGPTRNDPRDALALEVAQFGAFEVTVDDYVFADEDGAIFVRQEHAHAILATARSIWETERAQARALKEGRSLREQLRFRDYLEKRKTDLSYDFRRHLREIGGAIEE